MASASRVNRRLRAWACVLLCLGLMAGLQAAPSGAAQLRISSRFNLDDLDGFFASLADLKPVQATRDASGLYHVSIRNEK